MVIILETESRVVPAILLTIDLFSFVNKFKIVLLPTLGLPKSVSLKIFSWLFWFSFILRLFKTSSNKLPIPFPCIALIGKIFSYPNL